MIRRKLPYGAALAVMLAVLAATDSALWAEAGTSAAPVIAAARSGTAAVDPSETEGIIFERQQVMLQLERDADKLGDIIAGLAPRAQLGETARAIAKGAKDAEDTFAAQVPGGRSKPEVWSNQADYNRRMQEFVSKSEAMAATAEAGNLNGVIETLNDAMPCKACHDIYRAPKKPS